ncbi:hypothetical protein [Mycoplasma sp. 2575]
MQDGNVSQEERKNRKRKALAIALPLIFGTGVVVGALLGGIRIGQSYQMKKETVLPAKETKPSMDRQNSVVLKEEVPFQPELFKDLKDNTKVLKITNKDELEYNEIKVVDKNFIKQLTNEKYIINDPSAELYILLKYKYKGEDKPTLKFFALNYDVKELNEQYNYFKEKYKDYYQSDYRFSKFLNDNSEFNDEKFKISDGYYKAEYLNNIFKNQILPIYLKDVEEVKKAGLRHYYNTEAFIERYEQGVRQQISQHFYNPNDPSLLYPNELKNVFVFNDKLKKVLEKDYNDKGLYWNYEKFIINRQLVKNLDTPLLKRFLTLLYTYFNRNNYVYNFTNPLTSQENIEEKYQKPYTPQTMFFDELEKAFLDLQLELRIQRYGLYDDNLNIDMPKLQKFYDLHDLWWQKRETFNKQLIDFLLSANKLIDVYMNKVQNGSLGKEYYEKFLLYPIEINSYHDVVNILLDKFLSTDANYQTVKTRIDLLGKIDELVNNFKNDLANAFKDLNIETKTKEITNYYLQTFIKDIDTDKTLLESQNSLEIYFEDKILDLTNHYNLDFEDFIKNIA